MSKRIVIIGAGMAGTSAAYSMVKQGYDVTIVEKNDYIGGRMHTHLVDGAAIEMGAGFMTRLYTNLLGFLKETGMDARLYQQHGSSGIFRDGQIRMADFRTLAGNDALSWDAKLRTLPLLLKVLASWRHLDPHDWWKAERYDKRSVSAMFKESDDELLEYLLQPMFNGYFYWAPEHVSEAMLYSLGKAFLIQGDTRKVQGGLQRIPERAAEGSTVLLGCAVQSVCRNKDDSYEITIGHEGKTEVLQADGIVCATTASVVPKIFADLNEQQRAFFSAIEYSSGALIARTFKREQTRGNKGIAFPRREDIELSAVTVELIPGDTNNLAALKTYASGTIGKKLGAETDGVITRTLLDTMEPVREAVLVGNPDPLTVHIQRWPEALPYFDVGHFTRLREFEDGLIEDQSQALAFAGDYLGGPYMEGAFTSGMKAAARLHKRLVF